MKLVPAPKATDIVPEKEQVPFSFAQKVYPDGPVGLGVDVGVEVVVVPPLPPVGAALVMPDTLPDWAVIFPDASYEATVYE